MKHYIESTLKHIGRLFGVRLYTQDEIMMEANRFSAHIYSEALADFSEVSKTFRKLFVLPTKSFRTPNKKQKRSR